MKFDLTNTLPVRKREDGLYEEDRFGLAEAVPVEDTPVQMQEETVRDYKFNVRSPEDSRRVSLVQSMLQVVSPAVGQLSPEALALVAEKAKSVIGEAGSRYPKTFLKNMELLQMGQEIGKYKIPKENLKTMLTVMNVMFANVPVEQLPSVEIPNPFSGVYAAYPKEDRTARQIAYEMGYRMYERIGEATGKPAISQNEFWEATKQFPFEIVGFVAEIKLNPNVILLYHTAGAIMKEPDVAKFMTMKVPAPKWLDKAIKTFIDYTYRPFDTIRREISQSQIDAITDTLFNKYKPRFEDIQKEMAPHSGGVFTEKDLRGLIKAKVLKSVMERNFNPDKVSLMDLWKLHKVLQRAGKLPDVEPAPAAAKGDIVRVRTSLGVYKGKVKDVSGERVVVEAGGRRIVLTQDQLDTANIEGEELTVAEVGEGFGQPAIEKVPPSEPKQIVESLGLKYEGVTEAPEDMGGNLVQFTDPLTKSTLAIKEKEFTSEKVIAKVNDARAKWGVKDRLTPPAAEGGTVQEKTYQNIAKGKASSNVSTSEYFKSTEFVPVSELEKMAEYDRSQGIAPRFEESRKDILKNGINEPLIVYVDERSGVALLGEGNHRLMLAKELGMTALPVRIVKMHLSKEQTAKGVKLTNIPKDNYGFSLIQDAKPSSLGIKTVTPPAAEGKPTKEFGFTDQGLYEKVVSLPMDDIPKRSITTPEYRDDDVVATKGRAVTKPIIALVENIDDPNSSIEIVDGWHRYRQALANGDKTIPVKLIYTPAESKPAPTEGGKQFSIQRVRGIEKAGTKLKQAIKDALKKAEELGIKIIQLRVEDMKVEFDPRKKDEYDFLATYVPKEELDAAKQAGELFRIGGVYSSVRTADGQTGASIVIFSDANPETAYHEILGHGLKEQGGLPGWHGTNEQIADYIAREGAAGRLDKIIEFTPSGSRLVRNVGEIEGVVTKPITLSYDGKTKITLYEGAEIVSPQNFSLIRKQDKNRSVGKASSVLKLFDFGKESTIITAGKYAGYSELYAQADMFARKIRQDEVELVRVGEELIIVPTGKGLGSIPAYRYPRPCEPGNIKVKAFIFNMPAIYTCRNCTGCYAGCYAVGGMEQYATSKVKTFANLFMFLHHRDLLAELFDKQVSGSNKGLVRFHGSGDVFSQPYTDWLAERARKNPESQFWMYTKAENDYSQFDKVPNLNRVLSILPDGSNNFGKLDYVTQKSKEFKIPICPASLYPDKKIVCASKQWKGDNKNRCDACVHAKRMLFVEHGTPMKKAGDRMLNDIRDTNWYGNIQFSFERVPGKESVEGAINEARVRQLVNQQQELAPQMKLLEKQKAMLEKEGKATTDVDASLSSLSMKWMNLDAQIADALYGEKALAKDDLLIKTGKLLRELARTEKMTKDDIMKTQSAVAKMIDSYYLDPELKARFLRTLKNIQTPEDYQKSAPQLRQRLEDLKLSADKRKMINDINKLNLKALPLEYREMIQSLLAPFELKTRSGATIAKRMAADEFFTRLKDSGVELTPEQIKVYSLAQKKTANELTYDELEELHSQIMKLYTVGVLKEKLLRIRAGKEYEATVNDFINNITRGQSVQQVDSAIKYLADMNESLKDKSIEVAKEYIAAHLRPELMFELMGLQDAFNAMSGSFDAFTDSYAKGIARISEIHRNLDIAKMLTEKHTLGRFKGFTKDFAMFIYAHSFNPRSRSHLYGSGLTDDEIQAFADFLSPAEKRAVEKMFEYYGDEQFERFAKVMRELEGKSPTQEEDYFAIKNVDAVGRQQELEQSILEQARARKASVAKGFTKDRVDSEAAFLKLSYFNTILQHLHDVEHYIAYAGVIRDINRLMHDERIMKAIEQFYGKSWNKEIDKLIKDVAYGDREEYMGFINKIARAVRVNFGVSVLGANLMVIARQPASFFLGARFGGEQAAFEGLGKFISDIPKWTEFINERSIMMKNRAFSQEREFVEMVKTASKASQLGQFDFRSAAAKFVMQGIQIADMCTCRSLWLGVYDQAIRELIDPKEAAMIADHLIRRTQPMGGTLYLPAVYRGSELEKLYFTFTNQQNQTFNLGYESTVKLRRGEKKPDEYAYDVFMYFMVGAMLMGLITRRRFPTAKEYVTDVATQGLGALFLLGAVIKGIGGGYWGGLTVIDSIAKEIVEAFNAPKLETALKVGGTVAGLGLKLPIMPIYRQVTGKAFEPKPVKGSQQKKRKQIRL
jgi:hypothetical protein